MGTRVLQTYASERRGLSKQCNSAIHQRAPSPTSHQEGFCLPSSDENSYKSPYGVYLLFFPTGVAPYPATPVISDGGYSDKVLSVTQSPNNLFVEYAADMLGQTENSKCFT